MKLSIVILNYNVRHFLELCLSSVFKAIDRLDAEVIVVDNASSDESVAMVKSSYPKVKIIQNSQNTGFSKANNQGVAKANGEYICILNPDTVIAEETLIDLISFADNNDKVGIIGCRLIDGSGNFLPESKRNIPTPKIALLKLLGKDQTYYASHINQYQIDRASILPGAFMFIKKSVFDAVNGFDEDYFMYAEDVDISYKVLKKGYINYYYGEQTVLHFKGESTIKNAEYLKNFFGSMKIFYRKHYKPNFIYSSLVYMGLRFLPVLKSTELIESNLGKHIAFVSEVVIAKVEKHLDATTVSINSVDNQKWDSFVFNISSYSYESILTCISSLSKKKDIRFRFYLPDSEVIIGSDSSMAKGHLVQL